MEKYILQTAKKDSGWYECKNSIEDDGGQIIDNDYGQDVNEDVKKYAFEKNSIEIIGTKGGGIEKYYGWGSSRNQMGYNSMESQWQYYMGLLVLW